MIGAQRIVRRLSYVVVALMSVQAVAGLLLRSAYRDTAWIELTWLGNDLFTLFVAVPLLAGALVAAKRGSKRGEILWYAMLSYTVYNYAYYLFGAALNAFFPLYVALFVCSAAGLGIALARLDAEGLAAAFDASTPRRGIAGYMFFTGTGLAVAWLAQWALFLLAGRVPSIGEGAFHLVASLDMTFVVPFFLLGAFMLWRGRAWGYVLGIVMNVKGALYTGLLTVNSAITARAHIAGAAAQIPVWGLWCAVGCCATLLLLRHLREVAPVASEAAASAA